VWLSASVSGTRENSNRNSTRNAPAFFMYR
jgi:hypothetical protein